jgi:hypothetical protein
MRRTGLWQVVLLIGLVLLLAGGTRAGPPAQPPGDRYALLVGVREYDEGELRSLQYPEADVTDLAGVLRGAGYRPENIVLLTQTEGARKARFLPLAANIRRELRLLLKNCSPADNVLVALAGHGVQFKGDDESYFCPMDARLTDRQTLVAVSDLYRELEQCRAGVRVLLVDACRDAPQAVGARSRAQVDLESVTRPQKKLPPGGVAALFSCSAGERAFEDAELRHGIFFHFVIQGLLGAADLDQDGNVDLDELAQFVKKRVPDFARARYGAEQLPEARGQVRGLVSLAHVRTTPPAVHVLSGAIAAHYPQTRNMKDGSGQVVQDLLGPPTSDEVNVPGIAGARMNSFRGGYILWSRKTGAHVVYGSIAAKYGETAGQRDAYGAVVQSLLGLPTDDEGDVPGVPAARVSHFQNGDIYWSPRTGAHVVYGDIRLEWLRQGGAAGVLGLPTSDELAATTGFRGSPPDAQGRVSSFQHGAIYWSPATGAVVRR